MMCSFAAVCAFFLPPVQVAAVHVDTWSGFFGSFFGPLSLLLFQSKANCYGVKTNDGGNDCSGIMYDLGATFFIRNVVVYLPNPDLYGGNSLISSSSGVRLLLSTTAVRIVAYCPPP